MAGPSSSSAHDIKKLQSHIENGGSSRMPPTLALTDTASPIGSDVDSTASVPNSRAGGGRINRLGNLHGAGLSTLQLALGEISSPSSAPNGFNAISTLLNDPKRPQRPIDPNSSRYPAISQSHTELPKVKRSDLESYITSTQKEFDRFQRNLRLGSSGKAKLQDGSSEVSRISLEERTPSSDSADADHLAAIGKKKLSPLSTIPQVFFAEDFDLGNPYTFDLVTERYKAATSTNGTRNGSAVPGVGYDVALNQMLQEKLSYYSDVVEQHLILEISARSTSFFAALGNLQDLETEASHCLERVEKLKAELESKDEKIAKAGLRVIREQANRREIQERLEAVGLLQSLCEKMDLCRLLIQNGEWSEALEVMDLLRNVIDGTEKLQSSTSGDSSLPPHVDLDLSSIPAIKGMLPQLDEMQAAISLQLENESIHILRRDLEERIGTPDDRAGDFKVSPTGVDNAPKKNLANGTLDSSHANALQSRILVYLQGLIRTRSVDHFANVYRDVAIQATRNTLKTYLCESEQLRDNARREDLVNLLIDDEAASGKNNARLSTGGAEAANRLREMSHVDILALFGMILKGFTRNIESIESQVLTILQVLSEAGKKEADEGTDGIMMPMGVSPSLPTMMNSLIAEIGSLTHVLGSRFISLRSSVHTQLSLQDFLKIFHLCWTFILQSENTCKRMLVGFRGVILNQAKSWLANFHRQRIEKAARAVEEENWNQAETNSNQQKNLNLIIDSATSDPQDFLMSSSAESKIANEEEKSDVTPKVGKTLQIDDRQFFVVGATLDVLDLLVEYIKVVINLPLLCTETMGRVVEFAKQFNSRTCQVVLGAGAMRSAGLKNITAKHLALASQSLSIMITLIPYIRETIRRHLSPTQAVMLIEFDKLKRDYQEHQNEIHSKLVAIMSDRLTVHCRSLGNLAWNEESGVGNPVQPVADLTKEVITLHRVLFKFWHSSSAENVIGQVLKATDGRIAAEFQKVEVKNDAAIQRMTSAKTLLAEKLSSLKDMEWTCSEIEAAIEEKKSDLEKSKAAAIAAAAPPPEKKESIPAYKPRMNIFQRRSTQNVSLPANTRVSLDVAEPVREPVPEVSADSPERKNSTTIQEEDVVSPTVPSKDDVPAIPEKGPMIEVTIPTASTPPPIESSSPARIPRQEQEGDTSVGDESIGPMSPSTLRPDTPIKPSTPTPKGISIDGTSTPGRMTLQQRLAEAAKRRAQGGGAKGTGLRSTSSGPPTPTELPSSPRIPATSKADESFDAIDETKNEAIRTQGASDSPAVEIIKEAQVELTSKEEEISALPVTEADVEAKVEAIKRTDGEDSRGLKDESLPDAVADEKSKATEVKINEAVTENSIAPQEVDASQSEGVRIEETILSKAEDEKTAPASDEEKGVTSLLKKEGNREPIEDIEALSTEKVEMIADVTAVDEAIESESSTEAKAEVIMEESSEQIAA